MRIVGFKYQEETTTKGPDFIFSAREGSAGNQIIQINYFRGYHITMTVDPREGRIAGFEAHAKGDTLVTFTQDNTPVPIKLCDFLLENKSHCEALLLFLGKCRLMSPEEVENEINIQSRQYQLELEEHEFALKSYVSDILDDAERTRHPLTTQYSSLQGKHLAQETSQEITTDGKSPEPKRRKCYK